jgi:NADH-quinone oxidoreductase subunit E
MLQAEAHAQVLEDILDIEEEISKIKTEFRGRSDELILMLQMVQKDLGYLPEKVLLEIADFTGLPSAEVFGVATFYTQFRLLPVGKHLIRVCRGTACHVRGSSRILKEIRTRLQVAPGETTKDRMFTLETVACLGACALAPVVVGDEQYHGRMTCKKAGNLLDSLATESS